MNYCLLIVLLLSCIFASGCGRDSNKQIREEGKQTETDSASQASVNKEILEQLTKLREETSDLRNKIAEVQSRPSAPRVISTSVGNIPSKPIDPPSSKPSNQPMSIVAGTGNLERVKQLVEQGYNVNTLVNGWAPLHDASANGRDKIVAYLLKNGADLNLKNSEGETPLDLASSYDRTTITALLKQNGAIASTTEVNPQPESVVNAEINTAGEEPADNSAQMAHTGISEGSADKLNEAINAGFKLNERFSLDLLSDVRYPKGALPLSMAVDYGYPEIVQLLISKGAQAFHDQQTGDMPLIHCIQGIISYSESQDGGKDKSESYRQVMNALLEATPALANKMDSKGYPLHYAVGFMDEWMVEALLKAGADPRKLDSRGFSPLHLAIVAQDHGHGTDHDHHSHDHDSYNQDDQDEDKHGHQVEISMMLLEKGADANLPNPRELSPLMMAAQRGYLRLGKALIDKGAVINWADGNGVTCLHLAAHTGQSEFCKMLIEKGVQLNPKVIKGSKKGCTPLDAAMELGSGEDGAELAIVQILKNAGGKSGLQKN